MEAEIDRITSGAGGHADEMRRLFANDSAKEGLQRSLVTKKTLERLSEIASAGEAAPDEDQEESTQDD